jgi:hypothetical protein
MKSLRIFVFLLAIFYIISAFGFAPWRRGGETRSGVLNWDVYGYSFYLSGLLHGDLLRVKYLDEIDSTYRPCNEVMEYGRFRVEGTDKYAFKYTIGNAYFYAPFYFGAHLVNKTFLGYKTDGYSLPYSAGLTIGWGFWSLWGIYLLGVFLLRYFRPISVLSTLFCIAVGTNYYAYTVQIVGMNHIPLFFVSALCLWAADNWAKRGRWQDLSLLAMGLGLAVVLRPTELVMVILLLAVLPLIKREQGTILPFLQARWGQILIAVAVGLAVVLPQILYWWAATGKLVHYSYQGEYFDFANPHLRKGLFSYRKGLYVYAPLMLLGVVGLPFLLRRSKAIGAVILLYLLANVYIILSWSAWAYGGSFGARSMIQSFAFWAIPMAAFFDALWGFLSRRQGVLKIVLTAKSVMIILAFAGLHIFQTFQYHRSVLHWENMSYESYWYTFLKIHYTEAELHHLWWLYSQPIVED